MEGCGYEIERAAIRTASIGLDSRVEELVRAEIERALSVSGGNKAEAARMLEIKRTTLLYRMKRLGIDKAED
jgi:transcriptional regulator with GAF, ATPase, and Fis domain